MAKKRPKQRDKVKTRRSAGSSPTRGDAALKGSPPTRGDAALKGSPPTRGDATGYESGDLWLVGMAFLAVSATMCLLLVLDHLGGLKLPGCGEGSACAAVASGPWGTVPIVGWPVSFVGLAYFVGLLVACGWIQSGSSQMFRWIVRLGLLISLLFVAVLLIEQHFCKYCLATHVGNLAFWIVVERQTRAVKTIHRLEAGATQRPVISLAVSFAVVMLLLLVVKQQTRGRAEAGFERDLAGGIEDILAGGDMGFTGRYLIGPENAAIRLVMFEDYQCANCRKVDLQIRAIMQERDDVSLSVKHFPMSEDCNEHFPGNLHANACWAARAAEAAGILYGNDGFEKMHHWLFDQGGSFELAELHRAATRFGFDQKELIAVMTSERTLQRIQADASEAIELGLSFTPMIFINGVELRGKGIFANRAVERAIEALAATNPARDDAKSDHPPSAFEKYVGDWREGKNVVIPPDESAWSIGPDDAPVSIVVWGDYREPYTAETDLALRGLTAHRSDVRYQFRHYPIDQSCNKQTKLTKYPKACQASRAAEAAGELGGEDVYWAMHEWLMSDQQGFSDDAVRSMAADFGLDGDELFQAMASPEIEAAIDEDTKAGKRIGLHSVPWVVINGRHVPRWRKQGEALLVAILDEAAQTEPRP